MAWKSSGRTKGLDQAEDESAREPLNSSSRCVAGLESATRDHTPLPRGQENPASYGSPPRPAGKRLVGRRAGRNLLAVRASARKSAPSVLLHGAPWHYRSRMFA